MRRGCRGLCHPSVDLRLPKYKPQKQQSSPLAKHHLQVLRGQASLLTFLSLILLEIRTWIKVVPSFGKATTILVLSSIAEKLPLISSAETLQLQGVNMRLPKSSLRLPCPRLHRRPLLLHHRPNSLVPLRRSSEPPIEKALRQTSAPKLPNHRHRHQTSQKFLRPEVPGRDHQESNLSVHLQNMGVSKTFWMMQAITATALKWCPHRCVARRAHSTN